MRVMLDTSAVISLFIFKTESMDRFKACLVKHQVILCSYVIDDSEYPAIRDELDLPILASAILEDVDVLISRDKDFLAVETERPEILTPEDFCMQYG